MDPAFQRGGVGTKLIQAFEHHLKQNQIPGYHLVVAANNRVGINFYERLGLKELGAYPNRVLPGSIAYGRKFLSETSSLT